MTGREGWGLRHGDVIVPGRHAVRLLGGGRRYEAYLGWDDTLHALVVVKLLRPLHARRAEARDGLAAEAAMLERLAHPAIVRAFGHTLDGDRPHLVLEFLDGPRLSTLLRRYGVAVEQALSLGLQLCAAVHYMGAQDVVHLDIKPRNIIMAGPPRLIDLSIARRLAEVPLVAGAVGTDAYMSPEQCDPRRRHEIGPASDVWGMGVTLYEALTGLLPFPRPARDAPERHPQRSAAPAPFPSRSRIPADLAQVVLSCMEARPADRPRAAEVAAILEPLVDRLPRPRLGLFRPGGRSRRGGG